MLPDGWKHATIENLGAKGKPAVKAGPFGSSLKKEYYKPFGYKIYGQEQVISNDENYGNYFIDENKYNELKSCSVSPGDILISLVGTIGQTLLLSNSCQQGIINPRLLRVSLDKDRIIPAYIQYILASNYTQNILKRWAQGGTMGVLNAEMIKTFPILLPPLPEQKKIAAILSTWDRAIEGTEELLANSQQQKKALMQQLLTGKKRLPGFTGEWQVHRLGEIADFLKGKGLSKADINPKGKTPCIHYGSLFTEQPSTITETKTLTNTFKGAVFSKKNDVLMPTSDVTPAGLAVASAIQKDNVLLGNDILIIRPNYEQLYGPFLSRIIRNSKKKILSFATGTTVFHLYASDMKGFQLLVPPLPEQKAIAAVLTTADEEITAIEADLSRLRQEKKALMQQLLTGKIRVAV